jgi:SAM-dependent methyltransferase
MAETAMRTFSGPVMDIQTRETLRFIEQHGPPPGCRLLEVGCGEGQLAAALTGLGFKLVAIDPDPQCVRAARERGVGAQAVEIEHFEGGGFDAVLFTRSLHHVASLAVALDKAASALVPGGLLIVDEFDLAAADLATALWYYDTLAVFEIAGRIPQSDDPQSALPPLDRWREKHADLHEGARMRAAIAERFEILLEERVPYLYWTAAARLLPSTRRDEEVERFVALEGRRIREKAINPVGLRWVARRR